MRYLLFLLGVVFLALKIFGAIHWSWWWIIAPWLALIAWYLAACVLLAYFMVLYARKYPEDMKKVSEFLKNKRNI